MYKAPSKTVFVALALLSLVACDRGDTAPVARSTNVAVNVPNEFASFVNKQHSLSAGQYQLLIATDSSGQSASYTLNIDFDDGRSEVRTGLISASSGPGSSCDGNQRPCESITLHEPGGLRVSLSADVASTVSLLDRADNVAYAAARNININSTKIDGSSYSEAYYQAIDPAGERSNLAKWKAKNGFNSSSGTSVSATFRDVKDLGYGRHMTARKNADGTMAFVVKNYLVDVSTDSAANYSSLNLDAAVLRAKRFHAGTNAIEFSPIQDGGDIADSIVKFYTFLPNATDALSTRRNSIDMDGRGAKTAPNLCLSCHGGRVLPLNEDGTFNSLSLGSAKLNLLDSESFEYSTESGFSKAELHDAIRTINDFITSSYPTTSSAREWDASYATEVSQGRYSGNTSTGARASDFVPVGWQDDTAWTQDGAKKNPVGTALLFKQVVEPHCYSCHSLQGDSSAFSGDSFISTGVNFSSYEKFKQFEDQIVEYVYKRGNMPASLRNYEQFWQTLAGAPSLLASHLGAAYDITDSDGNPVIREPGKPFAKAGPNRTVSSPASLNAGASLLSNAYQWTLLSRPPGATSSFTHANAIATQFIANTDGAYQLQLTTSNAVGSSTDELTIIIDSTLSPSQNGLSFATHIRPILGSDSNVGTCTQCHSDGGAYPTPVFYTDRPANAPNSLYADVMARVNLADPENSLLLRKPSGFNHVGNTVNGFNSTDDADYQTVLNWIKAGALP